MVDFTWRGSIVRHFIGGKMSILDESLRLNIERYGINTKDRNGCHILISYVSHMITNDAAQYEPMIDLKKCYKNIDLIFSYDIDIYSCFDDILFWLSFVNYDDTIKIYILKKILERDVKKQILYHKMRHRRTRGHHASDTLLDLYHRSVQRYGVLFYNEHMLNQAIELLEQFRNRHQSFFEMMIPTLEKQEINNILLKKIYAK